MKKLRISVNDRVYDVTVEVIEDDDARYQGSPYQHVTHPQPPPSPPPSQSSRPVQQSNQKTIVAPIVGTIRRILVEQGSQVQANQHLIVLDAMKMDSYVNSHSPGTVKSVHVNPGDTVRVGQTLITLE